MAEMFPVGIEVEIIAKSPVPVAGSTDATGKTGKVRGYTDLAKDELIHIIDLDEPIFVYLPGMPQFDPQTGERLEGHKVEWVEVPGSCLK